jgi:hypothetical protein
MNQDFPSFAPDYIFIVPYRDREQHKYFFSNYMKIILQDVSNYIIVYCHQNDDKPFNRGAMKNMGFILAKEQYPNHYKNITFIFNDIDTVPHKPNLLNYKTSQGMVKHFYGFKQALGGIISLNGEDFENLNGFPNYWGWGCEDNTLHDRCVKYGLYISRKDFYEIGDHNILHIFDGFEKIFSKQTPYKSNTDDGTDGITSITNIDKKILKIEDNIYILNVNTFTIPYNNEDIITRPITAGNSLKVVNNIKKETVTKKTVTNKPMKYNKNIKPAKPPNPPNPTKLTNPTPSVDKNKPQIETPNKMHIFRKKTGLRYF